MTDEAVPRRRRSRSVLSVVLLLAVIAFVAFALRDSWSAVKEDIGLLSWADVAASCAFAAVAILCSAFAWRSVLHGLGHHMPTHDSLVVYTAGQLGKYIPGSVWPFVVQAQLGRRSGIPRLAMVTSVVVFAMVLLASGGVLGPLALLNEQGSTALIVAVGGVVGAAVVFVLLYDARWLNTVTNWAGSRMGRDIPKLDVAGRTVLPAIALCLLGWVAYGLHAWFIARPLGAGADLILPVIGTFSLAFVGGLAAVPVPAGAGIREAIFVLMLAGTIGRSSALTVTLASRLGIIVVEMLMGGALGLTRVLSRPHHRGPSPTTE